MAYFIDGIPYDESKYQELKEVIDDRPINTFETVYRLNHETKMYEAFERTEEEKVDWFVEIVELGTITIDEVPEEYKEAVEARIPISEEEQWANEIMEEVSEYGY